MGKLLCEIKHYWSNRAQGYSRVNQDELGSEQKTKWLNALCEFFPDREPGQVKVLDVGTGPGFFAIILAEQGYQVTAVDCTEEMLTEARRNAGELAEKINWMKMDAQHLDLAEAQFDVVVTRNLTWVLEEPDLAYREWYRVLKKGGVLLNSDANWYRYLYDETLREGYLNDRKNTKEAQVEDLYEGTDIEAMERIACQVPLTPVMRPSWDLDIMKQTGFERYEADENFGERVLSEMEKINGQSTPVFLVHGVK